MSLSVFNSLCETWRRMSAMGRIVAIGAVSVSVLYGGGKGERGTRNVVLSAPHTQSISANVDMSSPRAKNWSVRGAWEDVFTLNFGNDFRFPYGSNLYNAVKVFSQGYIIPFTNPYSSCILADIGPRVSIVPGFSNFYYEYTQSNSYRFVWNNVPVGRHSITNPEPPQLNNFSLELLRSGDVLSSSNGVVRTIPRTFPFDWDRDGIINERDNEPLVYNGDNFGNENILPYEANSNNYCWVDIVVSNSISRVTFQGDGESNYPDPDFVALPNCTYRVYLLIGKTYEVLCNEPVVVSNKSSSEISVTSIDNKPLKIVWPVTYEIESVSRSASRRVRMKPAFISGLFNWSTNTCCTNESPNSASLPMCEDTCECQGCLQFGFTFSYEGYKLSFEGIECGCIQSKPEEGPLNSGVIVEFSKRVIIFEDSYMNTTTQSMPKQSTQVALKCVAHGGPNGGIATFFLEGEDRLLQIQGTMLPYSVEVSAETKVEFEIVFEGLVASEIENDIIARAIFIDNADGTLKDATDTLTVVRIELEAVDQARSNPNENRHIYGVHEWVKVLHYPNSPSFNIAIQNQSDDLINAEHSMFFCPWTGGDYLLVVNIRDAQYTTCISVIEPQIVCKDVSWVDIGVLGEAGLLEMRLALYVEPTYVSFKDLNMVEIPDDEICPHTGYFANGDLSKVGLLSHSVAAGAGVWGPVFLDGSWKADRVGRSTPYPKSWSDGWKEWRIPVGWGDYLKNIKGTIVPNPTTQEFIIDSSGTSIIRKYKHEIKRTINNRVWIDNILQN